MRDTVVLRLIFATVNVFLVEGVSSYSTTILSSPFGRASSSFLSATSNKPISSRSHFRNRREDIYKDDLAGIRRVF